MRGRVHIWDAELPRRSVFPPVGLCLVLWLGHFTVFGAGRRPVPSAAGFYRPTDDGVVVASAKTTEYNNAEATAELAEGRKHSLTGRYDSSVPYGQATIQESFAEYYSRPESPHQAALKWLGISFMALMGVGLLATILSCLFASSPYAKERRAYYS